MASTLRIEVDQAWADAAKIIAEANHVDTYEVLRGVTLVPDGSGGSTTTPITIESGPCSLTVANRLGGERVSGNTVIAVSIYVGKLPITANVKETDTLRINGNRTFEITDVKTGGMRGMFTEVTLEERT